MDKDIAFLPNGVITETVGRIMDALQRGEMGHFARLPEYVHAAIPAGQHVIQRLEVRAVETSSNEKEADTGALSECPNSTLRNT